MLAIRINQSYIDLLPGTAVNFTMVNPVFDRDRFERIYSYPFSIPLSPHNQSIFRHAERLDANRAVEYDNVEIIIGGIPFENGKFILVRSTESTLSVRFENTPLSVLRKLEQIKVNTLDLPVSIPYSFQSRYGITFAFSGAQAALEFEIIQINEEIFIAPVGQHQQLVDAIHEVFPGTVTILNNQTTDFQAIIDTPDPTRPFYINTNVPGFDPTVYLRADLALIAGDADETVGPRIIDTISAHLDSTLPGDDTHVFPCFYSEDFFNDETNDFLRSALLNDYFNDTYPDSSPRIDRKISNSRVPQPFLKTVLDEISRAAGFNAFAGAFFENEDLKKLIIYANATIDRIITESHGHDEIYHNVGKLDFNLADGLPDITGLELLQHILSTFAVVYGFESGNITVSFIRDILKTEIEDWTDRAAPRYTQDFTVDDGYTLEYEDDSTENDTEQLPVITVGAGGDTYKGGLGILKNIDRIRSEQIFSDRKMFHIEEPGRADTVKYINPNQKARIAFYRGVQNDEVGNAYPLACHDNIDSLGNPVGELSLAWDGDAGRFENFWKELIRLETAGDIVKQNVRLTVADLLRLKRFKQPRKRINHLKGNMVGVIKQVQFKASSRALSAAKVTFVKE